MRVLLLVLVLALLIAVPHTAGAATDASCKAESPTIHLGDKITIRCEGFTRDRGVWVYAVDPNGTALAIERTPYFVRLGGANKADANGAVTFSFDTHLSTPLALLITGVDYYAQLGEWTFVVQELAIGGGTVHQAEARVRVQGGTESVAGAHISISPERFLKDAGGVFTITGTGFGANEVVTLWAEQPATCSSRVQHYAVGNAVLPQLFVSSVSVLFWDDVRTDARGTFVYTDSMVSSVCDGERHFVARGNTSGRGGQATMTVTGSGMEANDASLEVSPTTGASLNGVFGFRADDFGANESLSCWSTTPDGRALPYPIAEEGAVFKTDAHGSFQFTLTTGGTHNTLVPGITGSEGALGRWAMTCRGNVSHRLATADYTLTGGVTDP